MKTVAVFLLCVVGLIDAQVLTPSNGYSWGNWVSNEWCPRGSFVSGFDLRVEGSQGSGDDTAANDIKLYCTYYGSNSNNWVRVIQHPHQLPGHVQQYTPNWGDWTGKKQCGHGWLTGFRIRAGPSMGDGDDTALNDVQMKCQSGAILSGGGMQWGSWGNWVHCRSGYAICGCQCRFEQKQYSGDDTALNNIRCFCCKM